MTITPAIRDRGHRPERLGSVPFVRAPQRPRSPPDEGPPHSQRPVAPSSGATASPPDRRPAAPALRRGAETDVAVIGGGIVGLASALAIAGERRSKLLVLEAEPRLAMHQTGHNSGVIHGGVYYRPDSLKARLCAEGREALLAFCGEHGIPYEQCGKLIVATRPSEVSRLSELEERGRTNGLRSLRRCSPAEVREREPHVAALAALLVPETGIVSFPAVAAAMAEAIVALGGEVKTGARVLAAAVGWEEIALETTAGPVRCRNLVNCAGLHSDRVARLCGLDPAVRIVPFRGEYYRLRAGREHLVRHLVYPVPDPALPFLGVHFTRTIDGGVEAGPNAVLALGRHGYRPTTISPADLVEMVTYRGFWRMATRHAATGWTELCRSVSRGAFVRALQRLVPEITTADVEPADAGVRAQAVTAEGVLVDDFRVLEAAGMIHVVNAPSPAATASLAIGRYIAARAREVFRAVAHHT